MSTETANGTVASEKLPEKPCENSADTDADVKSVINDVVAGVEELEEHAEELEDNKSEYESVEDEGETNSADGNTLSIGDNTAEEKKSESAETEVKEKVEHSVDEIADKESESNEAFIDEEGGEEAFAEMNEDDEYEDIDDNEEDDEVKVNESESIEPTVEDEHNVSDEVKTTKSTEEHETYVEGERQQGDGQESGDQSGNLTDDLDDDEDKRNPQYIPKRGAFYEHDDRMVPSVEDVEKVPEEPVIIEKNVEATEKIVKRGNKKLWSESDKWSHDLYNEDEQKPKSKEEVFSTYGYDIRGEDNAPKARRRRRYGRGPGKYTRNWQDEDAYSKMKAERKNSQSSNDRDDERVRNSKPSRGPRRPAFKKEDFPELPSNDREPRRVERNAGRDGYSSSAWNKSRNIERETKQHSPSVEFKTEPMKVIEAIENNRRSSIPVDPLKVEMVKTQTFENSRYTNKRGDEPSNGREKSNYSANAHVNNAEMGRPIRKTSHLQESNKSVNYNAPKGEHTERKSRNKPKNTKDDVFLDETRNTYNQNYVSDVSAGMQKLNIDKVNRSNDNESTQQRPKRYSSIRQQQRSVPEGLTSPMPQNPQNITVSHQQRPTPQSQFFDAGPHSPGFYPETSSPRSSFAYIQQNNPDAPPQSNQHPSRFMAHQMPPRYLPPPAPETSSEPPFIPQAVPPPTTPQTSNSHPPVLAAPTASFLPTYPPGYPQFPPPQFHPMPPPQSQAEIYRGGVTYYDPTAQQAAMRQLPQRRPKNAIPIVPPPGEM